MRRRNTKYREENERGARVGSGLKLCFFLSTAVTAAAELIEFAIFIYDWRPLLHADLFTPTAFE